jgi:hypothetical protein
MFSLSTLRSDHVVNLPILDDRPSVPTKIDNALFFLQPISFLEWRFLPSFVLGLIVPWLSIVRVSGDFLASSPTKITPLTYSSN